MRHYHLMRNHYWAPIINVESLWTLIPEEELEACKGGANNSKVPVIDTTQHGYAKVLGKGNLPSNQPFIVKARFVSERAEYVDCYH
jgi:large subunit ribosomal protein L27Ae